MRVRTARVPTGYRELEYLESSGTQYIDTGYSADSTSCISFKFQYTAISTDYNRVFGSRKNVNSLLNMRSSASSGTKFYLEWSGGTSSIHSVANPNIDTNVHEITLDSPNNIYKFDDTILNSTFGVLDTNTYNMYIFGTNDGGTDGSKRFYYYKHSKAGIVIQYLIPVERQSDGKPGLYDTVNQQFYTNSGTGEFIKGPYKDSYKTPILIEEGTTNLGGTSTTYSNFAYDTEYRLEHWGGADGYCWFYGSGGYENAPYVKYTSTSIGSGGIYKDTTDNMVLTAGKTYVMSCYIKADQAVTLNNYGFTLNRHSDNRYETFGTYLALTTEWKRFSKVFTVGSSAGGNYCVRNITYNNVPVGVSVYWSAFQLEEKDHVTPFTLTTRPDNYAQLATPKIVYAEGTKNWGRMGNAIAAYTNSVAQDWKIEKLGRDTLKVTALVDNPRYTSYGNICPVAAGVLNVPAGEPCCLSCEIVDYKGSLGRIYPCSGGFGSLIGHGEYMGRIYRVITYTQAWTHDMCIRTANQSSIKAGDYLVIKNSQIELKDHPTLYTPDTRSDNSII